MTEAEFMKRIEVVEVGESDVLVLETDRKLSCSDHERIMDAIKLAIGDAKALVLSDGLRLAIVPKNAGE